MAEHIWTLFNLIPNLSNWIHLIFIYEWINIIKVISYVWYIAWHACGWGELACLTVSIAWLAYIRLIRIVSRKTLKQALIILQEEVIVASLAAFRLIWCCACATWWIASGRRNAQFQVIPVVGIIWCEIAIDALVSRDAC